MSCTVCIVPAWELDISPFVLKSLESLNAKWLCPSCVVRLHGGFVGPRKLLVSGAPYLRRVLGPIDGVLSAVVVRWSPVEVELFEAVDPWDGPVLQGWRTQEIQSHQNTWHISLCWITLHLIVFSRGFLGECSPNSAYQLSYPSKALLKKMKIKNKKLYKCNWRIGVWIRLNYNIYYIFGKEQNIYTVYLYYWLCTVYFILCFSIFIFHIFWDIMLFRLRGGKSPWPEETGGVSF